MKKKIILLANISRSLDVHYFKKRKIYIKLDPNKNSKLNDIVISITHFHLIYFMVLTSIIQFTISNSIINDQALNWTAT